MESQLLLNKINFKDIPLSLFFICFGVLLYTPLLIIFLHNKQNPYQLSELVVPASVCLSALVISIIIRIVSERISTVLEFVAGFVALYVFISVNIYPLKSGVLDGKTIPLNKISVIGHVGLAVACFCLFLKDRDTGKRIVGVIGSLSLLMAFYVINSLPTVPQKDNSKILQVGKSDNVFIIVMDMFQGYFVNKYIQQNNDITNKFDGFTYFDNAVSVGPYTATSTRYILTGKPPHGETGSIMDIDNKDNIINDAIQNGYIVKGITIPITIELPNLTNYYAYNMLEQKDRFIQFAYSCAKRYFPSQLMPDIGTPLEFGWLSKTKEKDSFQWFVNNLNTVETIPKTFHYYHNLMTHQPIRFNSIGEFSKKRAPDDLYGEIGLAFNMLEVFLVRLKKIGVYDNSTIIITGDHGYNILNEFTEKTLPPNAHYLRDPIAKIKKGQHDVALMIKPPRSSGKMSSSDAPVVLSDLRKTLNEIMVSGGSKSLNGENILQRSLPKERKVTILSYISDKFDEPDFRRFDNWRPLEITIPIRPK